MRRRRISPLGYQQVESRNLLASISLNGGELVLGGGSSADAGTVSVSGGTVTATLTGVETMSFSLADVDTIRFVGLGGNDSFTNSTSIPSFAFGQAGNDTLIGGSGNDRLVGGPGDDTLEGNDGDDEIRGGADGTKIIDGGDGNDRLFGGTGDNTIRGGDGDDIIFGGDLVDIVFGGDGDDEIYPGHGLNEVDAGAGDDLLTSGRDADVVFGGDGDDRLFTGPGDDIVDGGDGDDWIGANDGEDTITGGDGADRLNGGADNDEIEGGAGISDGGVFAQFGQVLSGGEGDDTIIGGDDPDRARGDAGDDIINLRGGDDVALGGSGDDMIRLGDGNDYAEGNEGEDLIEGNAGDDNLIGGAGNDRLVGGSEVFGDTVSYLFNQPRYRIAGSDLFVRDLVGDDGTDDVDQVERLIFPNNNVIEAESQIEETVTIQPIIVSNNNGSNTAEFFGTDEQETLIKEQINDIYYQALVEIVWLAPNTWNNTFANVGNGGNRPIDDAFEIINSGEDDDDVANSNSNVINMYFIEVVPGGGDNGEDTTNGVALDGENGVTFQVGDNLPTFEDGRAAVARVAAHEIAHNLGLEHVPGNGTNLMNFPSINTTQINTNQAEQIIESRFSR